MWLCNVVGAPAVKWASPVDQSGTYGLTKVVCEKVTFSPDPNPGYGLRQFRIFLRLLQLLTRL